MDKKTVVLCGAAQGMGYKIARHFLESGSWNVIVLDLLQGEVKSPIQFYRCDVSHFQETQSVIQGILSQHSSIEALVNSIRYRKPLQPSYCVADEWEKSIKVDLNTHFNAAYLVCDAMKPRAGDCSIINLSSVLSDQINLSESISYHAAKAAINQITRYLAVQYGPYNIRVNSVLPGLISNEQSENYSEDSAASLYAKRAKYIPLRRSGAPQEVAKLIYFLASDAASFITGQTLVIDGGLSICDQYGLISEMSK